MKKEMLCTTAAVVFQAGVLAFIAGEREWIARTGRTVWLRTAPIDPRDPMRGDYARLSYEISQPPEEIWTDGVRRARDPDGTFRRDLLLYATLRAADDGTAGLVAVTDRPPAEGIFIRGRTERTWGGGLQLRYGIEALFLEQGKSQELEDRQRGEMRGVPLRVQVALSPSGIAVLKGWQWDSFGLTLRPITTNGPAQFGRRTVVVGVEVVLKNHGLEDVAIVDLPGGGSFALLSEPGWNATPSPRWANATNVPPNPRPQNVVLLRAGQSHTSRVDLLQPWWFVSNPAAKNPAAGPVSLADLPTDRGWSFRLEYRPPPAAACAGLPNAERIWHGRLKSARFGGTGGVD